MIYKEVSFYDFCDSFSDTYRNNFSFEGKRALYDYLDELSNDTGENIELDTIAICCDYTEWDSLEDIKQNYDNIEDLEDLQNNTQVIEVENGHIIIQNF